MTQAETTSAETDAVRAEVVRIARLISERGLAVGTSGNVGARLEDGRIAITPSTMAYGDLSPDDVVIVEPDGAPSAGRRRPSSELPLQLAVFRARQDVRAIVHTHSPYATAFAIARRPIPAVHYVMAQLVAPGHDAVNVARYATFGTDALGRSVVAALGDDAAVLLASHGAITVGATLASAFDRAERIEELAALTWRSEQMGGPILLDAAELDRVRAQMARHPRQARSE